MEVTVSIEKVFPVETIQSQRTGSIINKYSFIGVTQEKYPKRIFFVSINNDPCVMEGYLYNVSFDIDCHEYNGRWFAEVKTWRVAPYTQEQIQGHQQAAAPIQSQPVAQTPYNPTC